MSTEVTATVTYTEALIQRAILRFWLRFIDWHGFATIGVAAAICLWLVWRGTSGPTLYGAVTALALLATLAGSVYVVYLRRSLSRFRRMDEPTAEVTISEAEFRVRSTLADSKVQWRAIEAIWRFPEVWLLFLGKNVFLTLPIAPFSPETREMMCAKVKENGGRVL